MPQSPYNNIFDLEYFNGSQCFLYIGDVWIDELTSLSYERSQMKRPIYGYASQLWDDAAAGQVIVQGQFSINYKEQGYLWAVLNRYFEIQSTIHGVPISSKAEKNLLTKQKTLNKDKNNQYTPGALDNRPLVGSNGSQISRASVERLIRGEATKGERYEFYHSMAGYSTFDSSSPRDKLAEDVFEVFEDQIWGIGQDNDSLKTQLRRVDDNRFDGFDIYVVFGNFANPKANHTVQKIIDVRLMSESKVVQLDGQPIQETYGFLAQTTA